MNFGLVDDSAINDGQPHWRKRWVYTGVRDADSSFLHQIENEVLFGNLHDYPFGPYEVWIYYQYNPVPQKAAYFVKVPEAEPTHGEARREPPLPESHDATPSPEIRSSPSSDDGVSFSPEGADHDYRWAARRGRQIERASLASQQNGEVKRP